MPKNEAFIKKLFSEFYSRRKVHLDRVESREFGVGNFEQKVAYRHMAFKDEKALGAYLSREAPPYISCSSAYYRFPDARPMEKKEIIGGELVFDLDATDMDLQCQKEHGKGWVCSECISSVKNEAIKLVEDFLIPDFGFGEKDISINFSGNRGYHVRIADEIVSSLNSRQRIEISDYISGDGLSVEGFFVHARGRPLLGPRKGDYGWGGKLARRFTASLELGVDALVSMGIDRKTAATLYRKKGLVEMGINTGNWDMVYIKNKVEFWNGILAAQAVRQSDRIDKNVTNDPSHLIRLPDTLHGETGLVARRIKSLHDLGGFDPMTKALAFSAKPISVNVNIQHELSIGGSTYGPYNNKDVELPLYAAVYLILKGAAELSG